MRNLKCGCRVDKQELVAYCDFHFENQPRVNDPLYKFLNGRKQLMDNRPMVKIKAEKNWLRLNNNWHLLVDIEGKVYHRTVIIYDTTGDYSYMLESSKKIKENDLIEFLRQTKRIDLEFIGD